MKQKRIVINNPLAAEGLRVIDSTSSEFLPEINLMLTPEEASKAAPFHSNSLVLANDTGRYVWGFTVIYTYPDQIAPSGRAQRHIVSPSPGGAVPQQGMLPPGGRYLITPVSGFQGSRGPRGKRTLGPDDGMDAAIKVFETRHWNARVEISIDSVIFDDGTIEGPDEARTQSKVNSRIRADKAFAAALENLTGDQLRAKLAELATTDKRDEYSWELGDLAGFYELVLNRVGESRVIQEVQMIKAEAWFPDSGYVRRKAKSEISSQ